MTYRLLTVEAATAEIRTCQYNGRQHLVVPVIALVGDTVVRPMSSDGAEFVPAKEIAAVPEQWNGRPVVMNHPTAGSGSANQPKILESSCFGSVFDAEFSDNRLRFNAYLDIEKANDINEAADVITRCQSGEIVEISVGVFLSLEKKSGVSPSGQHYDYIWHNVRSDHLAMLSRGSEGACSVENHGCGAPRILSKKLEEIGGDNVASSEDNTAVANVVAGGDAFSRFASWLGSKFGLRKLEEGVSDIELREKLWSALRAVEPAFDWIVEIFPEDSTVIYTSFPEDKMLWWRRSFTVTENGDVTLNDDREQVEPKTVYEVVAAKADSKQLSCKCQENKLSEEVKSMANEKEKDKNKDNTVTSANVKSLADTLVTCKSSPFGEDQRKFLEGLTEDQLTSLISTYSGDSGRGSEQKTETKVEVKPETPPSDTVNLSKADYSHLKSAADAYHRQQEEVKSSLVTVLKTASKFSEDQLKSFDIPTLETLAESLNVNQPEANYSGKVIPKLASNDEVYNAPDPWKINASKDKAASDAKTN